MDHEPGVYYDVPFEEYCEWPYVNNSSLTPLDRSPAHYKHALDNPRESTKAQQAGSWVHRGVLEPLEIVKRCVVMPDLTKDILTKAGTPAKTPKNTDAYRQRVEAFEAMHVGQEVVPQSTLDEIVGVAEKLRKNGDVTKLAAGARFEVSFVWDDPHTKLRCKGRADMWNPDRNILVDLKTSRDAADFPKAIADYAYHRQLAFYQQGLWLASDNHAVPPVPWIIAVEINPPYENRCARMSERSLVLGRLQFRNALDELERCRSSGVWPGYRNPHYWDLPNWYYAKHEPQVELTIGGTPVTV